MHIGVEGANEIRKVTRPSPLNPILQKQKCCFNPGSVFSRVHEVIEK